MYKFFVRPFLFLFFPETAHSITFFLLKLIMALPGGALLIRMVAGSRNTNDPVLCFGLNFKNPVGLAAGLDKNAECIDAFDALGFGFIEIGTVTPRPQPGNPKPRLFRLVNDSALINRMGFNNDGVEIIAKRLARRRSAIIVGANIGKNKDTLHEKAADDYLICFNRLFDHVDFFTLNVSSPNTPGLRALQEKEPLSNLLALITKANASKAIPKPILLKIAPDLTSAQVEEIVDLVIQHGLHGMVVSNTTVSRTGLSSDAAIIESIGNGGLSGKPVLSRSNELLAEIVHLAKGRFSVIASGGIFSAGDALRKKNLGAPLVELYTGFIYEGTALVSSIVRSW